MAQSNNPNPANPGGIVTALMARFSAIGDVAMTVPVIYSACRTYPDIHFVMVTRASMVNIFVNAPANLTVEGINLDDYHGVMGMRRLVEEMAARHRPDVFLDLHDVLRTRLMGLWCASRHIPVRRINKGRAAKRAITRDRNKMMLPLPSQMARYAEVFFKAGLPVAEQFDGLFGGRGKADPALFAAITGAKPPGQRWVGVAPFAAHLGKVYPPDQMCEVVERLAAHPDVKVFLLGGGPDETVLLEAWAEGLERVQNLAGKKYGFAAELSLLNHMDAVVTMDSANMHLAAIAGAPTISVWGATHPYTGFMGWHQAEADIVQLPMSCRPCSVFGDRPCRRADYLCLHAIKPEVIYNKIMDKIDKGKQKDA